MNRKQIAKAYRLAYASHLVNIQAYADGEIEAAVLKASACELKRLRGLMTLASE
jgi:hypothetical protein